MLNNKHSSLYFGDYINIAQYKKRPHSAIWGALGACFCQQQPPPLEDEDGGVAFEASNGIEVPQPVKMP